MLFLRDLDLKMILVERTPFQELNIYYGIINFLNENSLTEQQAFVEPNIGKPAPGKNYQFQRQGYYVVDPDSTETNTIFNRTVGLRDNWSKK